MDGGIAMSENPFYEQLRKQFDPILEQDKRRRRRTAFLFLAFHLFLAIAAAVYMLWRSYAASTAWYPIQTEIVWVVWGMLALSWLAHAVGILLLNRTVVSDTVRESLLLIASHQGNLGTPERAEKRKRKWNEPDIDDLESDSIYITDDGELRYISERR